MRAREEALRLRGDLNEALAISAIRGFAACLSACPFIERVGYGQDLAAEGFAIELFLVLRGSSGRLHAAHSVATAWIAASEPGREGEFERSDEDKRAVREDMAHVGIERVLWARDTLIACFEDFASAMPPRAPYDEVRYTHDGGEVSPEALAAVIGHPELAARMQAAEIERGVGAACAEAPRKGRQAL